MNGIPQARLRFGVAVAALAIAASFVAGAARAADVAYGHLRKGEYSAAVPGLRDAAGRKPGSATAQRDLGIALFKSGDARGAVPQLQKAAVLDARDGSTFYFLGAAAEASGDSALALTSYRSCLARDPKRFAPVRAQVAVLARAEIARNMAYALKAERDLKLADVPVNTIAVPEFALSGGPDSLRPLCRGLAVVMLTDLGRVPQLRVVERERLQVLLKELDMARSASPTAGGPAVDRATAPRYGKLIGARRFAQGAVSPLKNDDIELYASVIDAQSGEVRMAGVPVDGPLPGVLGLEKRLVFAILDTLGVPIDAPLRTAIGVPPTRSFKAFMAFSRGVDLEDRGLGDAAAAEYRDALALDPWFSLAQERYESVRASAEATGRMEHQLMGHVGAPPASGAGQHSTEALGFGPVGDVVPDATTLTSPSHVGARSITIAISW